MDDNKFLRKAIENSKRSMEDGNFPAGALVVIDNAIVSSEVSSKYPGLLHADSKATQSAFISMGGPMPGATLYCSMEPCLMCTSVAYWGGIRRVVFAIRKSQVNPEYYENRESSDSTLNTFHQKIEKIHVQELESEGLTIVKEWEKSNGF